MTMIYVVPRKGLKVPDPAVKGASKDVMLPPEGKWVEKGPYWTRRLKETFPGRKDADVSLGEPPEKPAAKHATEATKKSDKSAKAGE